MSDSSSPKYKRILLKLSGEALRAQGSKDNISPEIVARIAREIAEAQMKANLQIAIVVGGGNIWRGAKASVRGMDRPTADYGGMLATVMNALSICSAVQEAGVPCHVMSAIEMKNVAEPYVRNTARELLRDGQVVFDGKMSTLRRFQDEVEEVKAGLECGIRLADYNDYEEGDIIECYSLEKIKQTL